MCFNYIQPNFYNLGGHLSPFGGGGSRLNPSQRFAHIGSNQALDPSAQTSGNSQSFLGSGSAASPSSVGLSERSQPLFGSGTAVTPQFTSPSNMSESVRSQPLSSPGLAATSHFASPSSVRPCKY